MHEMRTKLQEPTVFHKTAATILQTKTRLFLTEPIVSFFSQLLQFQAQQFLPPFLFSNDGLIDRSLVSLLPEFSSMFHKEL